MNYAPIVVLTLAFGAACGYFQYWMACRLTGKRWLLILQPALFLLISVCFGAWTLSIDRLRNSPARLAFLPFCGLLLFTLAGWGIACLKTGERK